jgi:bifunctional non-homologous end joining protein LigD
MLKGNKLSAATTRACQASTASARYAFDLIELDGDELRCETLHIRKATLASLLKRAAPGLRLNEHIEADGATVFAHACQMGLEGIADRASGIHINYCRFARWPSGPQAGCWPRLFHLYHQK